MKRLILFTMLVALCATAMGRNANKTKLAVSQQELVASDLTNMLNMLGIRTLRFDVSPFADRGYSLSVYVDQIDSTGRKRLERFNFVSMRLLFEPFTEEARQDFRKRYGLRRKAMSAGQTEYLTLMILHQDSIARLGIGMDGETGPLLRLKGVKLPVRPCKTDSQPSHLYDLRPFKTEELHADTKGRYEIPLVYFASFWYDAKYGIYRSCGASRIDPEMSDEIVGMSPHKLVIGIILEAPEDQK